MSKPDWSRDELILALELYFREPTARGSKNHPEVVSLSKVLNQLPIHHEQVLDEGFRNPSGVAMKLSNFPRLDHDYKGKGLSRGSKLEEEVWNTFLGDTERLKTVASAIRNAVVAGEASVDGNVEKEERQEQEAPEGKILTRLHMSREPNNILVARKKREVMSLEGKLECEVCGFDFNRTYGEHGSGYAECHHTKPISKLGPGDKTRSRDLAIVCANCHRMLHRGGKWPTNPELRNILRSHAHNASHRSGMH